MHERCLDVLRAVSDARDDAGPCEFALTVGPFALAGSGSAAPPHIAKHRRRAFWNYTVSVVVPRELRAGDVCVAPGTHCMPRALREVRDHDLLIGAELSDELRDALADLDMLVQTERELRAQRDATRERADLMGDAEAQARTIELAERLLES